MKPLDPGWRRDVEYQLAQGSLRNLALFRRVITATSLAAAYASVIALLVALADGPWLLLGMLAFALVGLIMLPGLLFLNERPNGAYGS